MKLIRSRFSRSVLFIFLTFISQGTLLSKTCQKSRPVVLLHGINADRNSLNVLQDHLEALCTGTQVFNIEVGDGRLDSFTNLWRQTKLFAKAIEKERALQNGFDLIAHSQGGLVARAYVETRYPSKHSYRVHQLITLGSPHRGVDGIPFTRSNNTGIEWLDNQIEKIAYEKYPQATLSVAQMWNDPLRETRYLEDNIFLPLLNNEVEHSQSETFRQNMLSLSRLVIFKSTKETVVSPPASCWFNYFMPGTHKLVSYNETREYQNDRLGLKTLDKRGDLLRYEAHCEHTEYPNDPFVLETIVELLSSNASQDD